MTFPWQWLAFAAMVVMLVLDHRVIWPAFVRGAGRDPTRARRTLWARWAAMLWTVSALVLAAWQVQGTSWAALGLAGASGWRLWGPVLAMAVFVALQVSAALRIGRLDDRSALRARLGSTGAIMPRTSSEMPAWLGLSVTAGFCEELLFRGFLVAVLQPALGLWPAAAVALVAFAFAHAYQGREGIVRSGVLGALFMGLALLTRSLWPGIVLHALLDAIGGWIGWMILRDPAVPDGEGAAEATPSS